MTDRFGNGSIRVTTRGALQLHGVRKANLRAVIHEINEHLGSTLARLRRRQPQRHGARRSRCAAPDYDAARAAAFAIADALTPRTQAYYEDLARRRARALEPAAPVEEPIYGAAYLPRKFKIAVTAPGDNSVDLYTNDIGVVAIVDADGTLEGYNLTVGGGLGMTHGKHATFPRLGR